MHLLCGHFPRREPRAVTRGKHVLHLRDHLFIHAAFHQHNAHLLCGQPSGYAIGAIRDKLRQRPVDLAVKPRAIARVHQLTRLAQTPARLGSGTPPARISHIACQPLAVPPIQVRACNPQNRDDLQKPKPAALVQRQALIRQPHAVGLDVPNVTAQRAHLFPRQPGDRLRPLFAWGNAQHNGLGPCGLVSRLRRIEIGQRERRQRHLSVSLRNRHVLKCLLPAQVAIGFHIRLGIVKLEPRAFGAHQIRYRVQIARAAHHHLHRYRIARFHRSRYGFCA